MSIDGIQMRRQNSRDSNAQIVINIVVVVLDCIIFRPKLRKVKNSILILCIFSQFPRWKHWEVMKKDEFISFLAAN